MKLVIFYSIITFPYTKYFVHSYTVDVVFTLSYLEWLWPFSMFRVWNLIRLFIIRDRFSPWTRQVNLLNSLVRYNIKLQTQGLPLDITITYVRNKVPQIRFGCFVVTACYYSTLPCWIIITLTSNDGLSIHPASRLLPQLFVQAKSTESIKAPRHWLLWGESTSDRWVPLTKDQ